MEKAILEKRAHGFQCAVHYDSSPDSPREWDNLGVIYSNHRDVQPDKLTVMDSPAWSEEKGDWSAKELDKLGVWLPLSYYDHSCFRVSEDSPYTDSYRKWDSGCFGFIIAPYDKIRKEFGKKRISKQVREKTLEILRGEIKTLDAYLNGEVYGWTITDDRGELVDSCWGYYGDINDIMDECVEYAEAAAEEVAEMEIIACEVGRS